MNKAVEIALKYIGQTEKPGNSGFTQVDFEKRMQKVGFQKGQAWCAYFSELVFKEAYPEKAKELDKLFSASAVQTYKNFTHKENGLGYSENQLPEVGNLVIWQNQKAGEPQWTGHAGIVVSVIDSETFESVEGNTNDGGGREGYIVAKRTRKVLKDVKNGLEILGFIKIQ